MQIKQARPRFFIRSTVKRHDGGVHGNHPKQYYVKTARVAGVPERRVIYRYALRNALLPVIPLAACWAVSGD